MIDSAPLRILLGPQRPTANLGEAIAEAGLPDGPLAVISAGWQEAENDIDDVRRLAGRPLEDLCLYQRADQLFSGHEALAAAHRAIQDRLKELQRLYRVRLKQLSIAARQILGADGERELLAAEQRHAITQLRALDRHHLRRAHAMEARFAESVGGSQPALDAHRREIAQTIARCSGVLITGGNIGVLRNRMRLFGMAELLADKHIVAWSAGAMALARRVVLFHDRTPQGRRDPEILGAGCGLIPGYVLLPDAAGRLREQDRVRIALMSRRFAPDSCITLDGGASLKLRGDNVLHAAGVRLLGNSGTFRKVRAT